MIGRQQVCECKSLGSMQMTTIDCLNSHKFVWTTNSFGIEEIYTVQELIDAMVRLSWECALYPTLQELQSSHPTPCATKSTHPMVSRLLEDRKLPKPFTTVRESLPHEPVAHNQQSREPHFKKHHLCHTLCKSGRNFRNARITHQ